MCEYKIICDQAAGDIRPYPQCSDSNWGPGTPVQQYGLTPSHSNAILAAPNGRAEVLRLDKHHILKGIDNELASVRVICLRTLNYSNLNLMSLTGILHEKQTSSSLC